MDIMLMGCHKAGKTSIKKVVFEKLSPHESVFLETTNNIEVYKLENFCYTCIVLRDYPHDYNFEKASINESKYMNSCGVLIFVIDCQDINDEVYEYFKEVIYNVYNQNNKILVEIFIHKADGAYFTQTNNINKLRSEIQSKVKEIINELNFSINPGFQSTSIYDHSLFEAFSKIFQKLIPQNSFLSSLLDTLSTPCQFEKVYLFDIYNKIYLATDSSPMEEQFYEICSDMIDVVMDMSGIYGDTSTDYNFDENSYSLIKINNPNKAIENKASFLYLRFIESNLALIAIIKDENYDRQHLIDYNIKQFKEAVKDIYKV